MKSFQSTGFWTLWPRGCYPLCIWRLFTFWILFRTRSFYWFLRYMSTFILFRKWAVGSSTLKTVFATCYGTVRPFGVSPFRAWDIWITAFRQKWSWWFLTKFSFHFSRMIKTWNHSWPKAGLTRLRAVRPRSGRPNRTLMSITLFGGAFQCWTGTTRTRNNTWRGSTVKCSCSFATATRYRTWFPIWIIPFWTFATTLFYLIRLSKLSFMAVRIIWK